MEKPTKNCIALSAGFILLTLVFAWFTSTGSRLHPIFLIFLLVIGTMDVLFQVIPWELLAAFAVGAFFLQFRQEQWLDGAWGLGVCGLILAGVYSFGNKRFGAEKIPFGFADVLFGALLAFNLGLHKGLLMLAAGFVTFGVTALLLKAFGWDDSDTIPFAPFLIWGVFVSNWLY